MAQCSISSHLVWQVWHVPGCTAAFPMLMLPLAPSNSRQGSRRLLVYSRQQRLATFPSVLRDLSVTGPSRDSACMSILDHSSRVQATLMAMRYDSIVELQPSVWWPDQRCRHCHDRYLRCYPIPRFQPSCTHSGHNPDGWWLFTCGAKPFTAHCKFAGRSLHRVCNSFVYRTSASAIAALQKKNNLESISPIGLWIGRLGVQKSAYGCAAYPVCCC
ncbi:hypothetical protein F4780DRAFT_706593 [Xylariomycetidae sp. FL0641]|nr:hypothetical protein F4780DRAFT_706593 [Xylariomycetidae sp. FL0641]